MPVQELRIYGRMPNTVADDLSRNEESKWLLSPRVVLNIFETFGAPEIDPFASHQTYHLPTYMSLDRWNHNVYAVDLLNQRWDHLFLYTVPPPTLVPSVLSKLKDTSARMTLVAPYWSDRCSVAVGCSVNDLRLATTPAAADRPTDQRLDRWWWIFPRVGGFWENVRQFISRLHFFLKVEISSRTTIPLFRPGSVHSGSAS